MENKHFISELKRGYGKPNLFSLTLAYFHDFHIMIVDEYDYDEIGAECYDGAKEYQESFKKLPNGFYYRIMEINNGPYCKKYYQEELKKYQEMSDEAYLEKVNRVYQSSIKFLQESIETGEKQLERLKEFSNNFKIQMMFTNIWDKVEELNNNTYNELFEDIKRLEQSKPINKTRLEEISSIGQKIIEFEKSEYLINLPVNELENILEKYLNRAISFDKEFPNFFKRIKEI
jgi:hypothetical protein